MEALAFYGFLGIIFLSFAVIIHEIELGWISKQLSKQANDARELRES